MFEKADQSFVEHQPYSNKGNPSLGPSNKNLVSYPPQPDRMDTQTIE